MPLQSVPTMSLHLLSTPFFGTSLRVMSVRLLGLGLTTGLILVLGGACSKSAPSESGGSGGASPKSGAQKAAVPQPAASTDVAARIHWIGKKQLAADTNSATVMGIWALPESVKLEAQLLDKLALAPWPAALTNLPYPVTNYPALVASHPNPARVRPLLDDLLHEESYLEVRTPTNRPAEAAFAIRLSAARAALWESNLAAVVESATGVRPGPAKDGQPGWESVPVSNASPSALSWRLARIGDWTLLGFAPASSTNSLLAELRDRIQSRPGGVPFAAPANSSWLEAILDLRWVSSALSLGWQLPTNLPMASMSMAGEGGEVRTRADFDFPNPLHLLLEPWNFPTNLIHDPLIGFTAVRGFRPLLQSLKFWTELKLGTPPNQAFFWGQGPMPNAHYVALPSAEASNQVNAAAEYILEKWSPIFSGSKLGYMRWRDNPRSLVWEGPPIVAPSLEFVESDGKPFILAGLSASRSTTDPLPPSLLPQVYGSTNLLCYDWELSGESVKGLTAAAQVIRHMFQYARVGPQPAIAWFTAAAPGLGNSVSTWALASPTRISLSRRSTIGFTGIELEFLMDWLESPSFPHGLHTFTAPKPPLPPSDD
jgi:hypothetical protein